MLNTLGMCLSYALHVAFMSLGRRIRECEHGRTITLTAHAAVQGLLGPDPKIVKDILEALWAGRATYTKGKAREAAGSAFTECLCWILTQVKLCTVFWTLMLPVLHCGRLCYRNKRRVCPAVQLKEPSISGAVRERYTALSGTALHGL